MMAGLLGLERRGGLWDCEVLVGYFCDGGKRTLRCREGRELSVELLEYR